VSKLPFKKILINGCSFVAGDEIVWNNFCKEVLQKNLPWLENNYYVDYISYRKHHNLGAQIGQLLNCPVIDLSFDGNSNTAIVLYTIKKIKELSLNEINELHVCIGWTAHSRRLKWSTEQGFQNIHHNHYDDTRFVNLHSYIEEEIIKNTVYDHTLNFIQNVMLLENFLIRHNITYTFWLSFTNWPKDDLQTLRDNLRRVIDIDKVSDPKNWLVLDRNDEISMFGESWVKWCDSIPNGYISSKNNHPSMLSVSKLALEITKNISSRFLN